MAGSARRSKKPRSRPSRGGILESGGLISVHFLRRRVLTHSAEQESQIVDGAGDRADVIEAGGERLNAFVDLDERIRAGFIPATPQNDAGRVIEPPVCVPIAPKHMPHATAAAEPLDEPPGVRSRFQGLRVIGGSIQA